MLEYNQSTWSHSICCVVSLLIALVVATGASVAAPLVDVRPIAADEYVRFSLQRASFADPGASGIYFLFVRYESSLDEKQFVELTWGRGNVVPDFDLAATLASTRTVAGHNIQIEIRRFFVGSTTAPNALTRLNDYYKCNSKSRKRACLFRLGSAEWDQLVEYFSSANEYIPATRIPRNFVLAANCNNADALCTRTIIVGDATISIQRVVPSDASDIQSLLAEFDRGLADKPDRRNQQMSAFRSVLSVHHLSSLKIFEQLNQSSIQLLTISWTGLDWKSSDKILTSLPAMSEDDYAEFLSPLEKDELTDQICPRFRIAYSKLDASGHPMTPASKSDAITVHCIGALQRLSTEVSVPLGSSDLSTIGSRSEVRVPHSLRAAAEITVTDLAAASARLQDVNMLTASFLKIVGEQHKLAIPTTIAAAWSYSGADQKLYADIHVIPQDIDKLVKPIKCDFGEVGSMSWQNALTAMRWCEGVREIWVRGVFDIDHGTVHLGISESARYEVISDAKRQEIKGSLSVEHFRAGSAFDAAARRLLECELDEAFAAMLAQDLASYTGSDAQKRADLATAIVGYFEKLGSATKRIQDNVYQATVLPPVDMSDIERAGRAASIWQ